MTDFFGLPEGQANGGDSGPVIDADEASNKATIAKINTIVYGFKSSGNGDQIKQFLECLAALHRLGESKEDEDDESGQEEGKQ